jgi:ankyrin repeat protein
MEHSILKLINNNNWSKIYKKLIEKQLDPNYVLPNGNTILHMASINNKEIIYII